MQNHWKYDQPCSHSKLLCFHELLFKECYYQHQPDQLSLMFERWGDLRHNIKRQLQLQGFQQTYPGCQYGINCIFLFRDLCEDEHSQFDKQWARRFRQNLLETKCPNSENCYENLCFYYHQTKENKVVICKGKPMNQLVAKQKIPNKVLRQKKSIKDGKWQIGKNLK